MDDLQFRRTIYADPNCTDDEIIVAAKRDPAKREFWEQLKKLDGKIYQASRVDVPEDLAHRLILRQSLSSHSKSQKRGRIHLALAASIALAFGVSYTLWQQSDVIDLGQHALAHVQQEGNGYALHENGDIDLSKVNAQLASLGATLEQKPGRIYYANFCYFDNIRSYHLVFEGENGKVTVFVIPDTDRLHGVDSFADQQLFGEVIKTNRTSVVLVADKGKSFDEFKNRLRQNMLFSA